MPSTSTYSPCTTGSATAAMAGSAATTAEISSACSAGPMTTTGEPTPLAKWSSMTCCAWTPSVAVLNCSSVDSPLASMFTALRATRPSTSAVPTQIRRGLRAMPRPIRPKNPDSSCDGLPKRGMNGQNSGRPKSTSRAGSRVIIAKSAQSTPTAPAGPSPRVDSSEAKSRQLRPIATVAADAITAGPALCSASAIASWRSSWRRSSSRNRAMSSRA